MELIKIIVLSLGFDIRAVLCETLLRSECFFLLVDFFWVVKIAVKLSFSVMNSKYVENPCLELVASVYYTFNPLQY